MIILPLKPGHGMSDSTRFVGHKFGIHNGRKFIEVSITENMVGHRLGEFSITRTFRSHGKVTKKVVEAT